MNKLTFKEVLRVAHFYRDSHEWGRNGGHLHIVLGDGNIRDKDINFCIEECKKEKDLEGFQLANMLLKLSKSQRNKIYRNYLR